MHPNQNCSCRYADVGCDKMEAVMDRISGKWKMRILFMVGAHGTLRYGELRRLLEGITHKMLSNQLKELAADGQDLMPIFDGMQAYIRKRLADGHEFSTAGHTIGEN